MQPLFDRLHPDGGLDDMADRLFVDGRPNYICEWHCFYLIDAID
jgi:hypothetical protein